MHHTEAINTALSLGTATALALLCKALAKSGRLTAEDVGVIRHAALLGFDEVRERRADLSPASLEKMEGTLAQLEALWGLGDQG